MEENQFAIKTVKSSQITWINKYIVSIRKYLNNSTVLIDKLCSKKITAGVRGAFNLIKHCLFHTFGKVWKKSFHFRGIFYINMYIIVHEIYCVYSLYLIFLLEN